VNEHFLIKFGYPGKFFIQVTELVTYELICIEYFGFSIKTKNSQNQRFASF